MVAFRPAAPEHALGYNCIQDMDIRKKGYMSTRERVDDFLGQKRLALVGVSRNGKDFTRVLFREFCQRGYDMVPVNPSLSEVEGRACYGRVQDVTPPVDGALLMTSPAVTEQVVRDCAEAGVGRVWMYRAAGQGA